MLEPASDAPRGPRGAVYGASPDPYGGGPDGTTIGTRVGRLGTLLDEVEAHAREADPDERLLLRARLQDLVAALAIDPADAPAADGSDEAPSVPIVRIRLFGCFVVERDGRDVTPAGLAGTLLRFVAVRGTPVHVDALVEVLWPEAAPGQGRTRLRNVLARLRDASGEVVARRGDCVHLAPTVEVDLHRFARLAIRSMRGLQGPPGVVRAAAVQRARDALHLATAELLPADAYAGWAATARQRHQRRHLALLDALADALADDGDVRGATAALLDAIDLDPWDEDRYVRAARLLATSGRRGAADDLLELARCMLAELDVGPTPAMLALARELRDGPPAPPRPDERG